MMEREALRCMWCGEFPTVRISFAQGEMLCKCPVTGSTWGSSKKAIEMWNKIMEENATLQSYFIQMSLDELPKYINYPPAYSRFIVLQRLAGGDYSLEAYNRRDTK